MTYILRFLNKPTLYNTRPWVGTLLGSILVFLLLTTFEPYSIKDLYGSMKFYKIAGFTLITTISCIIVGYVLPILFKKRYSPANWTIGKDLKNHALIILLITLGNFSFNSILGHKIISDTGISVLLFHLFLTLVIGTIAGTMTHFIIHYLALKRNLYNTEVMHNRLKEYLLDMTSLDTENESNSVILSGTTKESISLDPHTILYIESSANYIKIYYVINNEVKQAQLRTTINKIGKDLQPYTYLFRCHRAYIVNKSYVRDTRGNSQGIQLSLHNIEDKIPVSRPYVKLLKEIL